MDERHRLYGKAIEFNINHPYSNWVEAYMNDEKRIKRQMREETDLYRYYLLSLRLKRAKRLKSNLRQKEWGIAKG